MKKAAIFLSAFLFLLACNKPLDKKAQLAKLQAERDKISEQIRVLQDEIAKTDTADPFAGKLKTIAIDTAVPKEFNHYIEIQGKVDGEENISVSPRNMGVVLRILVAEGDRVSKGQVLAELDAEVTRRGIEELKDQLAFATTLYDKQKRLWDQKIGSEVQYLTAKNNKESLENRLKTMTEQLAMSRITSPISGTVEEVPIKIGQSVAPGMTAFRVVNFSRIKVVADIAEAYAPKIKSGDAVLVYFPDFNKELSTKLNFSSKYISPVNRTFSVEARLNPTGMEFKANMIAVLKINDYSAKSAFVVPVNLVQNAQEGTFIFVVREENHHKIARKQSVKTGMTYNGLTEVTEGLKAGDLVITTGYADLVDGQPVSL